MKTEDMVRHSMEETKKLSPEGLTVHSISSKESSHDLILIKEKYSGLCIWKIVLNLMNSYRWSTQKR